MATEDKALQIVPFGARAQTRRVPDLAILEVGAGISSSSAGLSLDAVAGNPITANPGFDNIDFVINGDTAVMLTCDASTEFIAVGAVTPATRLDVDGAISIRGLAADPALAPAGQARMYFNNSTNAFLISQNGSGYAGIPTGSGTSGYVSFWTGATVQGGVAQLFWDDTNKRLGINTATPQTSLDVASGQGAMPAGSLAEPGLTFTTDLDSGLRSAGADDVRLTVGATDRVIADTTGVEIIGPVDTVSNGTGTTLTTRLRNDGAALDEKNWELFFDAALNSNALRLRTQNDALASPTEIAAFTRTGRFGIGTAVPTTELDVRGGAAIDIDTFVVDDTNDRVGMGTTTPGNRLEVVTNGTDSGIVVSGTSAAQELSFETADSSSSQVSFRNSSATAHFSIASDVGAAGAQGSLDITDEVAGESRLAISTTEAVFNGAAASFDTRIAGAGQTHLLFADASADRVGVGTSSPAVRLHVTDDTTATPNLVLEKDGVTGSQVLLEMRTDAYTDTEAHSIQWTTGGGATLVGSFGMAYDLTANTQDFVWGSQFDGGVSATENMRLKGGGELGLGVSDPATTVDMSGALTQRGVSSPGLSPAGQGIIYFDSALNKFRASENNGAFVDLIGGGGGGIGGGGTAGQVAFFTSATDIASESNLTYDDTNNRLGINEAAPNSSLEVNGSFAGAITTTATNLTLDETHYTVLGDASGGNITVTLPLASAAGKREYRIKRIDNSVSDTVTIAPSGADTIDGATSHTLDVQYESVTFVSNGSNWFIF